MLLYQCREIKQKNEGGWEFYWDEESRPGVVVLEVRVQKFLDSSLIDVDVHPTYVSMVIKSKVHVAFVCARAIYVCVIHSVPYPVLRCRVLIPKLFKMVSA